MLPLAAALPAFLYFTSLYLQIDAYAGREKVVGLAEEDIPSLRKTMAEGWFYLGAFALLIFLADFLAAGIHCAVLRHRRVVGAQPVFPPAPLRSLWRGGFDVQRRQAAH